MIKGKRMEDILVVDDEEGIVEVLTAVLGESGYTVATACDGQEALHTMENRKFGLVITDIYMPRMDGLTLLRTIKEKSPELPVVIIAALGVGESLEEIKRCKAEGFLQKPFDIDTVKKVVDDLLH